MHIVFKTSELKQHLPLLLKAADDPKTATPILSHLLINPSTMQIQATDLDKHVSITFNAEVRESDKAAIPAQLFSDFIQHIDGPEEVEVTTTPSGNSLQLKAGNRTCILPTMKANNWPSFPAVPEEFSLSLTNLEFHRVIEKIVFAISHEESRYFLNGALLEVSGDLFRMVSTDGHRLALINTKDFAKSNGFDSIKTLISRSVLKLIEQIYPSQDVFKIAFDKSWTHFKSGPICISGRKLTGQFPDYRAVIPKALKKPTASIDAGVLSDLLNAAKPFANPQSLGVKLKVANGQLWIMADYSLGGEFADNPKANCSNSELTIMFRADYLTDLLSKVTGNVDIQLTDKGGCGLFRPAEDNGDYQYVVMPMRF